MNPSFPSRINSQILESNISTDSVLRSIANKFKILIIVFLMFIPSLVGAQSDWALIHDQNDIKIYAKNSECSSSKADESMVVLKVVNVKNIYAIANFHLDAKFGESPVNTSGEEFTYSVLVDPNSEVVGSCNGIDSKLVWVLNKPDANSPKASVRITGFHSSHVASLDRHEDRLVKLKEKKIELENSNTAAALSNSNDYKLVVKEIENLELILSK